MLAVELQIEEFHPEAEDSLTTQHYIKQNLIPLFIYYTNFKITSQAVSLLVCAAEKQQK